MDALIQFYKDKYTPAELVDHLSEHGLHIDDLLFVLNNWIEENLDNLREDVEELYGYNTPTESD